MKNRLSILFVLLTYLLTWVVEILAALTKYGYATVNVSKGLQTICTLSPGFTALLLTGVYFKKRGLLLLCRSIVKWRVKIKWYLLILGSIALCGLSLILYNLMYLQAIKPDEAYNFIFY